MSDLAERCDQLEAALRAALLLHTAGAETCWCPTCRVLRPALGGRRRRHDRLAEDRARVSARTSRAWPPQLGQEIGFDFEEEPQHADTA